jgi:hypothetical protein
MSWFSIVAASVLAAPVSAQVAPPAAPPDATQLTAKPIEPIVPPIQRVKPAVPKLDPRLSGQPQTTRSAGSTAPASTATVRAKYLASKAAKPKANTQAAALPKTAAPKSAAATKRASGLGKAPAKLPVPPVAAKAAPKPTVSQAPANPSANVKR